MKTTIKTLLLASAVALSLSACAGDKHHRGSKDNANCMLQDGKCPVAAGINKAKDQLSDIRKDSKSLSRDASDAEVKAHLDKVSKQIDGVSKTLQDTQKEIAKLKKSVGKKGHKKGEGKKEGAAKAPAPASANTAQMPINR